MVTEILSSVKIIEPVIFQDNRGWFYESYNKRTFKMLGLDMEFIQDNHSLSAPKHTVRGIHFQNDPAAQSKLVRCLRGRILDYAVDLRRGSDTYFEVGLRGAVGRKQKAAVHSPRLWPCICDDGGELRSCL